MSDAFSMDTFPAYRALRTDLHLACLRGPDLGCVIPVEPDLILGRGRDGVTDPYWSRNGAVVEVRSSRNGDERAYYRPRAGRGRRLRVGTRVKMGTNTWVVRSRAAQFTWPGTAGKPGGAGRGRLLRFMMPIFILALIVRLLPREYWLTLGASLALSAVVAVIFWKYLGRRWDEARLLLTVANRKPPAGLEDEVPGNSEELNLALLDAPGKRKKLRLDTGENTAVAVVGRSGLGLQQWLRGQAWALSVDLDVGLFETISTTPTSTALVVPARTVGSTSWCRQMERALGPRDVLPAVAHFSEVVGLPLPQLIEESWAQAGAQQGLVATVGLEQNGKAQLDLSADGPHGLVVGSTGSGKSEFLSTLVLSLAATHSPDDLRFVFIDFKGGAGLSHLEGLPHVEHSISDLDGPRVAWLLRALDKALQRRKQIMAELGVRSWSEARSVGPRLMVVVDEFQVLSEAHPDLMDRLAKLAAQGRSLGFHLILASQRPGGAITSALRSTLDLRVALRCTEKRDSVEVIGVADAADLPRIPGRAIIGSKQVQVALETSVPSWVETISEVWANTVQPAAAKGVDVAAVIPSALPDSIIYHRDRLGAFESPADSTLQPLLDKGDSVGVFGPRSHEGELAQIAAHFTLGRRTVWIGEEPPNVVGGQEVGEIQSLANVEVIPADDLGAVARALARISKGRSDTEVLVIREASKLIGRLESVVGVEQCGILWDTLVRVSSNASAGARPTSRLRLVVTDSKPRTDRRGLEVNLLRIPTRQTLLWGPLSGVLPNQMPGAASMPVTRPSDLEEFVSPAWGRVLATGLIEGQTVWAQISLLPPPAVPMPPHAKTPSATVFPLTTAFAPQPPRTLKPGTTILKPAAYDLNLEALLEKWANPDCGHTVLASEGWPRLAGVSGPILAIDPSKEVLRLLAGKFPSDALWLQASFPLPTGSGVLTSTEGVEFLEDRQIVALLKTNVTQGIAGAA